MSKSLQRGILFSICVALVLALSLTLVFFAGGGDKNILSAPQGQVSGVADAAANAYEHGTDSGRRPTGSAETYTSVSTGKDFYNAIKSNTKDILLTGNITLTSSVSVNTSDNLYWNDGSQCFISDTPFNHKIYGAGHTITIKGPHTSSEGMEMNNDDINEYGGLVSELQNGGAIYDVKVVITKGFAVQTWETWSTLTGGTRDYWLNVGGLVGYMNSGSQIDNVYVELADNTVRLASFKYISDGSPPQYVRAGAIVGEMGANATITNVTVNNKGLIVAGENTGDASHSVCAERWYGAVGNVVGWISARGGNVTLDNIRITGNGILRGYRVGNIGVAENSNVTTANFFDNFTGTYDSYENGYHKVYVNGETGSNYSVTNVYRKGSASVAGAGETTATGMNIGTTLTVPSDSAYDIYFDATVSDDRNNSLAIAFNQAPAASYKYTLVSGNRNTYENPETTSNAIVFRNLPTAAATWKSGDNIFTATLNSQLLFNPDTYENTLTKYEHGYTEGQTTSTGTPISTGDEWEDIFAPSASGTPSGTYYLTDDIVINGFTGKEMSGVTIDGNGKTIFVIGATQSSYSGVRVGGLVGDFTGGTIKNVRVVYINSCSIASTGTNPRFGLVAGSVNGSKIENVQVYVESGVTISASKAGDNSVAMGGVVGYATNNSKFTNVTLDLNGTLAPTGGYQYLGGIAGLIDSANGATFTNIILRGAGTFAGTAGNTSGEPTYYGAVGVIMAASTNITSAYATIDGLIYDFDVTLAGTGGGSTTGYSCYYLFTNNYNAGASDGHQTNSPISGYEGGVNYRNIFVAEKYVKELEGFAGERTNGNAAVGIGNDTTIKAIAGEVTGVSGATVTAYFVPTGNNSDITLVASQPSGGWGGVSQLKSDGDSSARSVDDGDMKVVTVAKANAATADNKVTLSEYVPGTAVTVTGVATQLVYNAAEQGATFTFEGGSPALTTHYSVVYAVNDEDPRGAQLGDTGLPLNAGNYTATIILNEDSGFVFKSADGGYTRQTTFEFAVSPYELTLQSGIATALAGTYGDYTVTSGAVSGDKITSLTQETLFGSSVPGMVAAYTVTVADQNDGLLNASTYSFTAGVSDTNYNLASGAIDGVVVSPYRVEGTWAFDGRLTLTYGDPVPNIDQYISVTLTSTDIPGGLTSVAASGFDIEYTQGTAAGETVNINAGTYSVDSGLASNYDFRGITGSGSVPVQKKELSITLPATEEDPYIPHISAVYGATGDKAAVQGLLTQKIIEDYVTGIYNGEEVSFTINTVYIAGFEGGDEELGIPDHLTLNGATPVNDSDLTTLDAGTYLITVTANSSNYTVAEGQFFVYGVSPATLTVTGVTFEGGFDGVYDGQAHGVEVQFSGLIGGDTYSFIITITDGENQIVEGNVVTNAGTYTVTVQADLENTNYGDVTYENGTGEVMDEYTITIDPYDLKNATVTIAESDLVYTGSEITVTPIVKGGENDFTSKLTVVVNGGEAVVNAGEYTITASGNTENSGNFEGEASGKFVVAQKELKLESLILSSSTYTGAAITVAGHKFADGFAPVDGEQPELVIAVQGVGAVVNAGEYTFNVSLAADNEVNKNYVMAEGAGTITATVSPASVTVTAGKNAELGALYGESATAETSRFYKDDFITFDPAKPDSTFKLEEALTFTVKNSSGPVSPAEGAYTLAPGTYTVTYTINKVENANYTLTADGELTTTLTVEEGALKLVIERWDNTSPTYNGKAQLPTPVFADSAEIGVIEEGALVYEVTAKEGALTGSDAINAGSYTVTVSIAAGFEQQYELVGGELSTDFTIEQLEVVLNWEAVGDDDLVYDGAPHELTATVGNKVDGDVVTVSVKRLDGNNNIDVTPDGFHYVATGLTGAAASNYKLPENAQSEAFNVTPAKVTLTWNFKADAKITYGDSVDAVKDLVDIAALDGEIPGVTDPLTFTVSATVNAGDYSATTNAGTEVTFTVNAKLPEGANKDNYNIIITAQDGNKLTVGKATLTLTIAESASLTKVYDGKAVTLASLLTADNVSVEGMKNGEDAFTLGILVINGTTQEITNVGEMSGSVTVKDDSNYTATALTVTYVITPKPISVAWSNTEFTYDGTAHKPTATATGLVEGDSLTLTVTGEQTNANAEGEHYTATVKAFIDGNYKLEQDATVEFTISRKTVSVAWMNTAFEYNGSAQVPTATATGWQNSENYDSTLNRLITISGDNATEGQAINAGDYTATITKEALEAALGNYTLAQDATVVFTVAPATLNVSVAIAGDGVADNTLTWDVEARVTVSGNSEDGWTLTSGETSYIVTVTGADGVASDVLQLTLNGSEYKGTPYGTSVKNGVLAVASTNPNYTVELVAPVIINILPDISIEINTGAEYPDSAVYSKDKTYTAEDFAGYFSIDGQPDGTWAYSVEGVESGSFSNVGTYTVKATFTIASGIPLENHFTFTITQATVTDVVLNGEGAYTYGELKAGDTVSVTVTYSDGNTATVNAGFEAAESTGGFVKAGESVELTLTGDDGANANYAKVNGQTVTVSVSKAEITADISYIDDFAVEGVLTLPYIGSTGYSHNITVTLYGVLGGDVVEGELETEIINANTYGDLTFALYGDDSYVITNAADLSVVVTPAEITVEWSNVEGLTYNGSAQAPTATAKGLVDGDSLTLTVTGAQTNANTDGGSYTATAAITGGEDMGNYVLAADATTDFTIAPKSIGVEWSESVSFTYNGSAQVPTATATGLVEGDSLTLTVSGAQTDANTNGGSYTATVKAFIDGNYKLEQDATVDFTISPKTVSVKWGDTELTYNGSAQKPTATVGEEQGLVAGDDLQITVSGEKTDVNTDGGSYTATAAITGGEDMGNYVLAEDATVDFTIKQLEVVLKWEAADDLVYNGKEHTATATVANKVGQDVVTVTVQRGSGDNVNVTEQGFVYVAIGLTGAAASNYKLPENAQSQAFNVKPAQVEITWNFVEHATIVYGDSVDDVKALVNIRVDGPIPGVTDPLAFEVSVGDYSATTNAGTEVTFDVSYTLPEDAKEENYNIIITAANGNTLTVGKATLNLSIADAKSLTKVYDGDAVTLDSLLTADNVSVKGMKNGEDAFTLGILAISGTDEMTNAGTYNGSVSVIDDCNYTAEPLQFSYKITPKPIGVAWSNTEFTYDGTAHKPTATATDLVDGDSLTLTVTGAQTNAGSYTATVAADSVTGNYVLAEDATVEFTIAPKSIGVAWGTTEFTYDGTAHKPTATATGLVDGDSLTLTVVTDAQTNAGSYTATVKAFVQGNYKLESDITQTFTIARRGLDVAKVAEAVYGNLQVNGTLVTGTHTAFVAYNDEEIELIVNVKAAALSRAAAEYLDAGEYEVTIALANENGNFSLNGATLNAETKKMEVQSTLDVAPKTVEVGYTTSSKVYDAKGISLTLEKFEDMLIEGDDPAVNIYINDALYTGKVVLDAGEYTVRYESADPNYAFTTESATFTVEQKQVTPNFDLNTGSGSQQITGGGKLEIEEGEETDIIAAIDNFMQSSGVPEEDLSISVSGDLKLEDMATWAPGTYKVTVALSGNHSGSIEFTVEVSEKIELPPPVQPELPETPVEAGSGNDWVLPLVIAIVALIDLALLVAIGVAAKKRA